MPKGKPRRPASARQARFFGAIAGGAVKVRGFTPDQAKNDLRGLKLGRLGGGSSKRRRRR